MWGKIIHIKEYNKAIKDLCEKNNCNIDEVTISQELLDLKKQIESSYDKANGFYKDLEYMRSQNRSLMDIRSDIRSYNVRVNLDNNNIIHLKIVDTVDYNFGEKEVEELRELQENGFIENYYIIVKIAVPLANYNENIDLGNSPYYNNFEMFPRNTNY